MRNLIFVGALTLLASSSSAFAVGIEPPVWKEVGALSTVPAGLSDKTSPFCKIGSAKQSDQTASPAITVTHMFSRQAGSWPFEPFALQGVFEIIAQHQNHHPRSIVISKGQVSLKQLAREINDPAIIKAYKKGFLLSYPLIIETNASLVLNKDTLYLNSASGSFVTNLGALKITDSRIRIAGEKPRFRDKNYRFRPFLISWAGSTTQIDGSEIHSLGFPGNLTQGITLARHELQPKATPNAYLQMSDTTIDNASTAIYLQTSAANLSDLDIKGSHHDAVMVEDSVVIAQRMMLNGSQHGTTLHLTGSGCLALDAGQLRNSKRPSVIADEFHGELLLQGSVVSESQSSGFRSVSGTNKRSRASLTLRNNLIFGNDRDGIELHNVGNVILNGNEIRDNKRYAISLSSDSSTPHGVLAFNGSSPKSSTKNGTQPQLRLLDNLISPDGLAGLLFEWSYHVVMGPQRFRLKPMNSSAFSGNLAPLQTELFRAVSTEKKWIEIMAPATF